MVDWVPLKHQLDILRMDAQFVLRQAIDKTDHGKVYRSEEGDWLPFILQYHGLLSQIADDHFGSPSQPIIWKATKFGRKIVDNDHAMREVAMEWMDFLKPGQLDLLKFEIVEWPFRDPAVAEFMQNMKSADGGPTHADFFPQAPWYWHTVGRRNVPSKLRNKEAEHLYVAGGYTGSEISAWDIVHGTD